MGGACLAVWFSVAADIAPQEKRCALYGKPLKRPRVLRRLLALKRRREGVSASNHPMDFDFHPMDRPFHPLDFRIQGLFS